MPVSLFSKSSPEMYATIKEFLDQVVAGGTCTGCGLCAGLDGLHKFFMRITPKGPRPLMPID